MNRCTGRQALRAKERQIYCMTVKSYSLKDNFEKLVQLKFGIGIPFTKMLLNYSLSICASVVPMYTLSLG